jgi:hypothetical protein
MLPPVQIQQFIQEGFVKIENAFSQTLAEEARTILWKELPIDRNDRNTWTEPVIRLGERSDSVFLEVANTPVLRDAFDQLVGKDNWQRKESMGSFPIRFPSSSPATDSGWHVDASFPGTDPTNYLEWRINLNSKARGLLLLFLFSDVGKMDAPTLLLPGSHREVARLLKVHGSQGLSFMELAKKIQETIKVDPLATTGSAGTVYLCHPFLVHAAQDHFGKQPKFMAQPSLMTKTDLDLNKTLEKLCPVERAIWEALHEEHT